MINKIAIIGLPGSGKSTLAQEIQKKLDLPIYHLDRHMFEPGSSGKKRDKNEFAKLNKPWSIKRIG
jgi:adenylate kinase family enzyme